MPSTNVTVPPFFGAEAEVDVDDELEEPHAASAMTEATARTAVMTDLVFLIVLLLRGCWSRGN
ncbi:MAG: hypothetical protein M3018_11085, partial [Actinomycetota bacterium]|nr:hypothetical protein [Actinomycetota bacterium]